MLGVVEDSENERWKFDFRPPEFRLPRFDQLRSCGGVSSPLAISRPSAPPYSKVRAYIVMIGCMNTLDAASLEIRQMEWLDQLDEHQELRMTFRTNSD